MQPHQRLRHNFAKLKKEIESGHPAAAILLGYRLVRRFPEFGPGWLFLGQQLCELARYEEAEGALLRALELMAKENRWGVLKLLGDLFREAGNYAKSADWYRKQTEEFPHDATGYIMLGAVLAKSGQFDEAATMHRRGTQCEIGAIDEAHLNLGLVLRAQERFSEAAECFREAIRRDHDYEDAKVALCDVELCLKLFPKRSI
ncbi:MAG TPA: tetratricopeptide repeat protein [Pirellulaceae bacterium]|nr:tetratricopeptide repeat protein [Pirellulaceae bacterium]